MSVTAIRPTGPARTPIADIPTDFSVAKVSFTHVKRGKTKTKTLTIAIKEGANTLNQVRNALEDMGYSEVNVTDLDPIETPSVPVAAKVLGAFKTAGRAIRHLTISVKTKITAILLAYWAWSRDKNHLPTASFTLLAGVAIMGLLGGAPLVALLLFYTLYVSMCVGIGCLAGVFVMAMVEKLGLFDF